MRIFLVWIGFLLVPLYSQSVRDMELELKSLKDRYIDFKAESILKRDKIDKEIKLLDDQINQLYNSKNIVQQEIFVLKDTKESVRSEVDSLKEVKQSLSSRIVELIDREKKKTKSLFPYLIEESLIRLKKQDALLKKNNNLTVYEYLDYRNFVIGESQKITINDTSILNPRNELVDVKELRIGFIHNSYISNDGEEVGFLINKMTFAGPLFSWKDTRGSLKNALGDKIFSIYNNSNDQIYSIPFDIGDMGEKLPYFLNVDGTNSTNFFTSSMDFFRKGGVLMYPLLLCFIIAFIIMIERLMFFRKNRIRTKDEKMNQIINKVEIGDKEGAKKICQSEDNILTRTVSQLIDQDNRDDGEKIIDEVLLEEVPKLEKRISTLGMLAGIAPLMGLLGTVVGMIALFNVITTYGSNNPKILAGGISIALITTQVGLAIAIPILIVQHILIRMKNSIVNRMDVVMTRLLNRLF